MCWYVVYRMSLQKTIKSAFGTASFSQEAESNEKAAVQEAMHNQRLPTPKGSDWEAIRQYYSLPEPVQVDSVQSTVVLPPGWSVDTDPDDVYRRCCIIFDHEKKKVGGTFLKNTGYDYYGRIHFNSDRLKELGIVQ